MKRSTHPVRALLPVPPPSPFELEHMSFISAYERENRESVSPVSFPGSLGAVDYLETRGHWEEDREGAWRTLAEQTGHQDIVTSHYRYILLTKSAIAKLGGFTNNAVGWDRSFESARKIWWLDGTPADSTPCPPMRFLPIESDIRYMIYACEYHRLGRERRKPQYEGRKASVRFMDPLPEFDESVTFAFFDKDVDPKHRPAGSATTSFYASQVVDGVSYTATYTVTATCLRTGEDFVVGTERHGEAVWTPYCRLEQYMKGRRGKDLKPWVKSQARLGLVFDEQEDDLQATHEARMEDARLLASGVEAKDLPGWVYRQRTTLIGRHSAVTSEPDYWDGEKGKRPTEFLCDSGLLSSLWGVNMKRYKEIFFGREVSSDEESDTKGDGEKEDEDEKEEEEKEKSDHESDGEKSDGEKTDGDKSETSKKSDSTSSSSSDSSSSSAILLKVYDYIEALKVTPTRETLLAFPGDLLDLVAVMALHEKALLAGLLPKTGVGLEEPGLMATALRAMTLGRQAKKKFLDELQEKARSITEILILEVETCMYSVTGNEEMLSRGEAKLTGLRKTEGYLGLESYWDEFVGEMRQEGKE
jgi:hypothetical protein